MCKYKVTCKLQITYSMRCFQVKADARHAQKRLCDTNTDFEPWMSRLTYICNNLSTITNKGNLCQLSWADQWVAHINYLKDLSW